MNLPPIWGWSIEVKSLSQLSISSPSLILIINSYLDLTYSSGNRYSWYSTSHVNQGRGVGYGRGRVTHGGQQDCSVPDWVAQDKTRTSSLHVA